MTEDERQAEIAKIRARIAFLERQEVEDRVAVEKANEEAMAARLDSMTIDEMREEVVGATYRVAASFSRCWNTKSKALIGGTFDQGSWLLNSSIMPYLDAGLHCLQYWVSDPNQVICIGNGPTKSEALSRARQVFALLGRHRLDAAVRSRSLELQAAKEAEAEEVRKQWIDRKQQSVPEHREKQVPKRRLAIFNKSQGQCHYCQAPLDLKGKWHIEHKMPRALMGSNADDNLVAACVPCNAKKRDRTDVEFIASRGVA